jgi:2-keto-4-pentenoate hydratase/2-oxohepta-3-ene-1,7-dioic acid hydratase in catechol pathway
MKIIRFEHQQNIKHGLLSGEKVQALGGDPFGTLHSDRELRLKDVKLLSPIVPNKIICIGLNYTDHILEMGGPTPEEPLIFLKAASALNGPNQPIMIPKMSRQVEYEGELAVIIGKTCRHVSEEDAPHFVLGFSCFNDVTARDLQRKDVQFARAKSFDTFACLGPWIETQLDPGQLKIETRVNGELKQSSNTSHLLFKIPQLVSFISRVMTLNPGDIISSGTPSGVGPLKSGDVAEVSIEGIGTLSNPVIQE